MLMFPLIARRCKGIRVKSSPHSNHIDLSRTHAFKSCNDIAHCCSISLARNLIPAQKHTSQPSLILKMCCPDPQFSTCCRGQGTAPLRYQQHDVRTALLGHRNQRSVYGILIAMWSACFSYGETPSHHYVYLIYCPKLRSHWDFSICT